MRLLWTYPSASEREMPVKKLRKRKIYLYVLIKEANRLNLKRDWQNIPQGSYEHNTRLSNNRRGIKFTLR